MQVERGFLWHRVYKKNLVFTIKNLENDSKSKLQILNSQLSSILCHEKLSGKRVSNTLLFPPESGIAHRKMD